MTVFASLTLLVVLSLLFTLLESARVEDLNASFSLDSKLLAESAFAQYDLELYEKYDLLLLDGAYGGEGMDIAAIENNLRQLEQKNLTVPSSVLSSGAGSFFQGEMTSCQVNSYELATDQEGAAFRRLITDYMRETITQQAAREIYTQITDAQAASEEAGDLDRRMDDADAGIEQVQKELEEDTNEEREQVTYVSRNVMRAAGSHEAEEPTPMDQVRDMKNTAVLSLVLENAQEVSDKAIQEDSLIENRTCNQGNWTQATASEEWYEGILYNQYVVSHFASYLEPNEDGALGYEQEYILVGKHSDRENLTGVAERLLAIREAVNYIELKRNPAKCAEALAMATTLAGATGNALIIKIVKEGILAAWAFQQSTNDVKKLLDGERISLGSGRIGLAYEDYLRILLFLAGQEKQNYHCMDMIEQNMRLLEGKSNYRMDNMIQQAAFTFEYEASPLFLSFVSMAQLNGDTYHYTYQERYSYLTG